MLPKANRIPYAMTVHGDTRIDHYYWLRDDTRSQPEVLDYLHQENEYGRKVMTSTAGITGSHTERNYRSHPSPGSLCALCEKRVPLPLHL
ncbi:oligopeptidase [Salmonella bongori]|nr:oligopeptidase [Salmonella bongori]